MKAAWYQLTRACVNMLLQPNQRNWNGKIKNGLGCGIKANCPHVRFGPAGGGPLRGRVFLKNQTGMDNSVQRNFAYFKK